MSKVESDKPGLLSLPIGPTFCLSSEMALFSSRTLKTTPTEQLDPPWEKLLFVKYVLAD